MDWTCVNLLPREILSRKTLEIAVITNELIYSDAMVTLLKFYTDYKVERDEEWIKLVVRIQLLTSKVILHFFYICLLTSFYSQWEMISNHNHFGQ